MHKAVRNITRLFERIQDFEKRVVKRRGQLDRADAEAQIAALVLLARALAPFAPHTAEELLLGSGLAEAAELPVRWPEAAPIPVAAARLDGGRLGTSDKSPPIKQTRLIVTRGCVMNSPAGRSNR